ncbi:MAG TPA: nitronate monooxygenase family protein [Rhodocyclaceae bacterium]|nr:nitronate monooxygenase family protein [Rhodocyclaceae bacterium]
MKTKVCEQLGIEVPIFGFSHCRDVVAAVSAAGGLGVLGATTFPPEQLEVELRWLEERLQGRPYGVNVLMADSRTEGPVEDLERAIPPQHREFVQGLEQRFGVPPLRKDAPAAGSIYQNMELRSTHGWARPQLEIVWRHHPKLLVSALGAAPPDVVERAHTLGMKVGGMTGSARHAQKHVAAGADLVIAAGNEGAGHNSDVATMVLVPEVVDAVAGKVPVLAAGGIGNGRQIAAAQAMGADGVWLGSIWLTTVESDLDAGSVEQLLKAGSHDTLRTRCWSGKPTRFLRNPWMEAWDERDAPEPLGTPLQRMLIAPSYQRIVAAGMHELMAVPVGQVVGQMRARRRVRDVMLDLQQEYLDAVSRLHAIQPQA